MVAATLALALAACDRVRPSDDAPGSPAGSVELATCTRCHGDPANGNPAPPRSLDGAADASDPSVGAHQAHLTTGPLRQPVACGECHAVPSAVSSPGHMNGTVDVAFGPLASAGGATTAWNPASLTCATYCHGATLPGGANTTPVWNKGPSQAVCGSCHGVPPPESSGHPFITGGLTACSACHPATVKADGTIDVAGGKHMNGTVDLAGGSGCTACHGDDTRATAIAPAPPRGTHGETSTGARAVGAHQTHLAGGAIRAAVACTECHVLPTRVPHANGKVDLTFGPLATAGGATPSFDGTGCNSVYCHGATLGAGGAVTAPIWTKVDGTQNACGACHAIPPPPSSGHPAVASDRTVCAGCHPQTVKADGTIDLASGKHINGTVDVAGGGTCTACHGDPNRTPAGIAPAPPRDTKGQTASDAVGAHLAHLQGGAIRGPVACNDCHTVPGDTGHSTRPLDLTWGALPSTGGVKPSWSPTTLTCTNYCHGATLPGGANNTPVWNGGSSQAACGACHALPPPTSSGHPAVPAGGTAVCNGCHPDTVTSTGVIDTAKGKHINGVLDVANLSCTSCHGGTLSGGTGASGANPVAAAPPRGTKGETATSARAVGLHANHLTSQRFTTSVTCAACHVVPTSTSHSNGAVAVTFGGLATTGGAAPAWNGASCSSVYCHGNFTGGAAATVTWANATVPALACTSCHGIAPATGQHNRHVGGGLATCENCHGPGYSATTVNTALHLNGTKNVGGAGSRINSFNASTRTCAPACHGSERW